MWQVLRPILGAGLIVGAVCLIWSVRELMVTLTLSDRGSSKNRLKLDVGLGESASRAVGALCVGIVSYELIRYLPDLASSTWQLVIAVGLAAFVVWQGSVAAYEVWPSLAEKFVALKDHIRVAALWLVLRKLRLAWALVCLGGGGWLLSGSEFDWL